MKLPRFLPSYQVRRFPWYESVCRNKTGNAVIRTTSLITQSGGRMLVPLSQRARPGMLFSQMALRVKRTGERSINVWFYPISPKPLMRMKAMLDMHVTICLTKSRPRSRTRASKSQNPQSLEGMEVDEPATSFPITGYSPSAEALLNSCYQPCQSLFQ
jgi:hypothetical protein